MTEAEALRKALAKNPKAAEKLSALIDSGKLRGPENLPTDEPLVLVGGPSPEGITGAKQFRCQCGNIVWLSPSSLDILATHPGETIVACIHCMLKLAEAEKALPSLLSHRRQETRQPKP